DCRWIRYIIEYDEVDAFMIEGVIEFAEMLLESFSFIKRSVMLSRHKMHRLHFQFADNILKTFHAVASNLRVFCSVGEVAGEDLNVRLLYQTVDRRHCFLQCSLRIRVDHCPIKSPMSVRKLHEIELIAFIESPTEGAKAKTGGEDHAS